jgi:hypothetical protein
MWGMQWTVKMSGPNRFSYYAAEHPLRWAMLSSLGAVVLAVLFLWRLGPVAVIVGIVVGVGLMFGLKVMVWRPGGPGPRWLERHRHDD